MNMKWVAISFSHQKAIDRSLGIGYPLNRFQVLSIHLPQHWQAEPGMNEPNCNKLSVALQYRRIFTGGKTKVALWCLIGMIVGCGIWSFCANLFFCTPIRKSWQPEISGTCLSKKDAWLSYSGANIFISTVLILLPLPTIAKLKLQWRTKIALIGIFSLGAL